MTNEARNHRDNVFRIMYKEKSHLLSLYNAVNKTNYDNLDDVTVVTLENAVCIGMNNDAAMVLDTRLGMFEQQSTVNPNMPLRSLFYVAEEYKKMVDVRKLYSTKLVKIPEPKFVVFYNGEAKQPSISTYKLSDQYMRKTEEINLELKATVYNINSGMNDDLLETCESLKSYMIFVEKTREKRRNGIDIVHAVTEAVEECIEENVMSDFFEENKEKIVEASIWEFDQELNDQAKFDDGYDEGYEDGREQGREEGLSNGLKMLYTLVTDDIITLAEAVKRSGLTEDEFMKCIK